MKKILLIGVVLCLCLAAGAQDRSKVGLVLSGGGAKGIAHIPLLKLIDSLGIHIDYVTGTSMGGIVGGLYAAGYKGEEIEELVRNADWNVLLSNQVFLSDINVEEKDEFGRYLAELPTGKNLRPKLPLGIIEGQALMEFLTVLTYHVSHVNSFDSLPIPFRCMSADIISGKPVVMKNGSLPLAMRSSMAIPTFFTPIDLDTMLLVDGGLVKNFPVEQAIELGADFIIGGYTGGQLYRKEELNSFLKILYQTSSFNRLEDSEYQKKLCDIYVNSNGYLDGYSAVDFGKFEEILAMGEAAAREQLPKLIELARSQQGKQIAPLEIVKGKTKVRIDSIVTSRLDPSHRRLALGKLNLKYGNSYTAEHLRNAVNLVYGTRFFDKAYYTIKDTAGNNYMLLHAPRTSPGALKLSLHYDNYQFSGVIINYTARDLLLANSRALLSLDFAENPKARLHYYKFISKSMRLWFSTEFFFERVTLSSYESGRRSYQYTDNFTSWETRINRTLGKHDYAYFGVQYKTDRVKPRENPENLTNPPSLAVTNYASNNWNLQLGYYKNTTDKVYFATRGNLTQLEARVLLGTFSTVSSQQVQSGQRQILSRSNHFNPLLKIRAEHKHYKKINAQHTLINSFMMGILARNRNDLNEGYLFTLLQTEKYYLGGPFLRPRENHFQASGLHEFEYSFYQLMGWQMDWQWNVRRNFFVIPSVNFFAAGTDLNRFMNNFYRLDFNFNDVSGRKAVHEMGYGVRFALNSRLGPVFFGAGSTASTPVIRYYWGFGYRIV